MKKQCTKCKKLLFLKSFGKKLKGLRSRCLTCSREDMKKHYNANKKDYTRRQREKRAERMKFLHEYKSSTPCFDCGDHFPYYCMDFDHLRDKKFLMSRAHLEGMETIKKEMAKCDLVCSNCHRKRTFKRAKAKLAQPPAAN